MVTIDTPTADFYDNKNINERTWPYFKMDATLQALNTDHGYSVNKFLDTSTGTPVYDMDSVVAYLSKLWEAPNYQEFVEEVNKWNWWLLTLAVQIALEAKGIEVWKIDWLMWPATKSAIGKFQREYNTSHPTTKIKVDNAIWPQTVRALLDEFWVPVTPRAPRTPSAPRAWSAPRSGVETLPNGLKVKRWEKVMKGWAVPAANTMFEDLPSWVTVVGWNPAPSTADTWIQRWKIEVKINGTSENIDVSINVVENITEIIKVKKKVTVGKGWSLIPQDFLENPGDLWSYTVDWNETPAPTSFNETKNVKIKIMDGTTMVKSYTCKVEVIEHSAIKPKRWEKVMKGWAVPAANTMFEDLPSWVTVVGWNPAPSTADTWIQRWKIEVKINGTSENIDVSINVVENITEIIKVKKKVTVGKGWSLIPQDFLENPGDLWSYTVDWNETPAPTSFNETKNVKIKIMDGTTMVKSYTCKVEVIWF